MCGICGIVDTTGLRRDRVSPEAVIRMSRVIKHRGPDGDGFYNAPGVGLGMRRLSIIDVDGSDQPLYNEDKSIALVFNGEIYNYRELRRDLLKRGHTLATEGDGETLIHLYEECGVDLFSKLRGMFAFALWDSRTETLLLAVDHIGMKPLYLYEHDGLLQFASEVKAMFVDPAIPREINLDVLDTYLSFGYMVGQETLFKGIRRLPPGHMLIVRSGSVTQKRYWQFDTPNGNGMERSDADIIEEARQRITESVNIHLRSDVPLGLFLSGGIDSAAVLALMAREAGDRIKTFTIGYATQTPDNELDQARAAAAYFKTDHHEYTIDAQAWWRGYEKYVYYHDEPNANPSAVSLLLLAKETAHYVKVVLTGLGGDELFGGYPAHRVIPQILHNAERWGRIVRPAQHPLGALERWYPTFKRYRIIGALPTYLPPLRHAMFPRDEALLRNQSYDGVVFSDALRKDLYGPALSDCWHAAQHKEKTYRGIVAESWRDDPYNTAQALVIGTWLTGNALLSQDKVTMAYSLEARVPFFDPDLITFAANVPSALRMRSNKYILREAVRPYLDETALMRNKKPFSTPIAQWFDNDLQENLREVIQDKTSLSRKWFNRGALERLLDEHFTHKARYDEVIFRLATLELWAHAFLRTTV